MSIEGLDYNVYIEDFAKRHYIKLLAKKYKEAWLVTETAIIQEIKRIDRVIGLTDRAEIIKSQGSCSLIKLSFRVASTQESAKSSGNRAIIYIDHVNRVCRVLLVYSNNEICSPNETQKWQSVIKENYPEVWDRF